MNDPFDTSFVETRRLSKLEVLFGVTLFELFVGGGGRVIDIGPLSLRMFLFAVCVAAMLWKVAHVGRRSRESALPWLMVLAYLAVHVVGLVSGLIAGNEIGGVFIELQRSAYWLIAPLFAMCLADRVAVRRLGGLVTIAAVTLALGYLAFLALLLSNLVDLATVLEFLRESPEFSFRDENLFFYKGFIYLGIGLVFFTALRGRGWRVAASICAFALVLALTRGFIIATSAAVLALLVQLRRWRMLLLASAGVVAAVFFMWTYLPSSDERVSDQRDISNEQRLSDLAFIADRISVKTVLIGEGVATPIDGRPAIENTFVLAFWRMGLPGLAFWLVPLVASLAWFARVPRSDPDYPLACALFYGVALVYLQTATNPYLDNPIGLSFALAAMFGLRTLVNSAGAPRRARVHHPAPAVMVGAG